MKKFLVVVLSILGLSLNLSMAAAPDAPVITSVSAGNGTATVNWTINTNGASIDSYLVEFNQFGPIWVRTTALGSDSSKTVLVPQNGTAVKFRITANYTDGSATGTTQVSNISDSVTPSTIPSPVTNVLATSTAGGQATISFATSSNGGADIDYYLVISSPDNISLSTTNTSVTFSGLVGGTSYSFDVIAHNANGSSTPATSNSVTVISVVPSVPQNLVAVAGDKAVTLSWSAPISNGGNEIDYYSIFNASGTSIATAYGTSSLIGGLTNGTTYTFTVRAHNANGFSNDSNSVSIALAAQAAAPVIYSGGGGSYYSAPAPSTTSGGATTNTQTNTSSQTSTPTISGQVLGASSYQFTKNLKLGMKDNEVKLLQQFLNERGYFVATGTESGSKGNETNYFGKATAKALIKYQEDNIEILREAGLLKGSGHFLKSTRNFINNSLLTVDKKTSSLNTATGKVLGVSTSTVPASTNTNSTKSPFGIW